MPNIESIVRQINQELAPQFDEKLRDYLMTQDKEWLVEQITRLTLDSHSLQEMDRRRMRESRARERADRISRLRDIALDREKLLEFTERYAIHTRVHLVEEGYLRASAPAKGAGLITDEFRTVRGAALLVHAKDVLFGLLFGDESMNVHFERVAQELLTLTLPRSKAGALDFMKATTELSAVGTWQDPKGVSDDSRADNVLLEVEYGEVPGEWIGHGIVRTLGLINNLEVNEQVLYGRMVDVEQSTLIE
jgi:hypothetical protein